MKKLILGVITLCLLIACQKESLSDIELQTTTTVSNIQAYKDYLSQYTGDRTVKLEWDQMRYHATFEGIQLGSETFASENEKRMYEVVVVEREEDD
jgi:hypothetical protein